MPKEFVVLCTFKRSTNTGSENRKRFANTVEHKFKDREKMQFNLDTWQTEKEGRIILPEKRKRYKTFREDRKGKIKYNIKGQKTTEKYKN